MDTNDFKAWREEMGLTQDGARALLGVSRVTVQNWENAETRIPAYVETACEMHRRGRKKLPDFGPVTLTYFDAPLWQKSFGPAVIPKMSRELYANNRDAISRLRELRSQNHDINNPLISDKAGDVVWISQELVRECEKEASQDQSRPQMLWHKVSIPASDVANMSARGLIEKFGVAYRAAYVPKGVSIFHQITDEGGHTYYFSPVASSIAYDLLKTFRASECLDPPNLTGMRKVGI